MRIKIYVEGGGESNALKTKCRKGFQQFFENAQLKGKMPAVVACGSRNDAYDSFQTALKANSNELPLLLVDSEAPVSTTPSMRPWNHLKGRDKWEMPSDANDNHAHLMVQCMEAWFLADRECLKKFFGDKFNDKAFPGNEEIQEIAKQTVFDSLKNATRQCKPKGAYKKSQHSFEILGRLDPKLIRNASPYADRLLKFLTSQ